MGSIFVRTRLGCQAWAYICGKIMSHLCFEHDSNKKSSRTNNKRTNHVRVQHSVPSLAHVVHVMLPDLAEYPDPHETFVLAPSLFAQVLAVTCDTTHYLCRKWCTIKPEQIYIQVCVYLTYEYSTRPCCCHKLYRVWCRLSLCTRAHT